MSTTTSSHLVATGVPAPTEHADDGHHAAATELRAALPDVCRAPADVGTVELVVRRPSVETREQLDRADLDVAEGLVGDCWRARGSRYTDDGLAHPGRQLAIMSSRVARAVAGDDHDLWAWTGDQLFVDLDLSETNLPPGSRLELGTAVLEVTDAPHRGCLKFRQRFGKDALFWINFAEGIELRLRGVHARVVVSGEAAVGDAVTVRRADRTP